MNFPLTKHMINPSGHRTQIEHTEDVQHTCTLILPSVSRGIGFHPRIKILSDSFALQLLLRTGVYFLVFLPLNYLIIVAEDIAQNISTECHNSYVIIHNS